MLSTNEANNSSHIIVQLNTDKPPLNRLRALFFSRSHSISSSHTSLHHFGRLVFVRSIHTFCSTPSTTIAYDFVCSALHKTRILQVFLHFIHIQFCFLFSMCASTTAGLLLIFCCIVRFGCCCSGAALRTNLGNKHTNSLHYYLIMAWLVYNVYAERWTIADHISYDGEREMEARVFLSFYTRCLIRYNLYHIQGAVKIRKKKQKIEWEEKKKQTK